MIEPSQPIASQSVSRPGFLSCSRIKPEPAWLPPPQLDVFIDADIDVGAHAGRQVGRRGVQRYADRNPDHQAAQFPLSRRAVADGHFRRRDAADQTDLAVEVLEGVGVQVDEHLLAHLDMADLAFVDQRFDPVKFRIVQ